MKRLLTSVCLAASACLGAASPAFAGDCPPVAVGQPTSAVKLSAAAGAAQRIAAASDGRFITARRSAEGLAARIAAAQPRLLVASVRTVRQARRRGTVYVITSQATPRRVTLAAAVNDRLRYTAVVSDDDVRYRYRSLRGC